MPGINSQRCVLAALALVAISRVHLALAKNDYLALQQPTLLQSDCAKRWDDMGSTSTTSSLASLEDEVGEFTVNLTVQATRFESEYVSFNTRAYNSQIPAPIIKICPGDKLVVNLVNELEAGSDNNTNLHTHGVHLSPLDPADNVMPNVEPGGSRTYEYEIDVEHPSGTFWYHPHAHGNVNSQLHGLMAGALIVADRPSDFPSELELMDDLVLMLQAVCVENCNNPNDVLVDALTNTLSANKEGGEEVGAGNWEADLVVRDAPLGDTSLPTVYVNGQLQPSLELSAGEFKRLRFINGISNNVAELVSTANSDCEMHVLAMDGVYYSAPKAKNVVVVPPGGRADVAVMCAKTGEFFLEIDCASSRNALLGKPNQFRVPSQRIVKLQVVKASAGDALTMATVLPPALPEIPSHMTDMTGVASSSIPDTHKYDYEFTVWGGQGEPMKYGVNSKVFDASSVGHAMQIDELQQWELSVSMPSQMMSCDVTGSTNCHAMNHPFHIHATHFQVSGMDSDADPDGVMFEVGEWRDTLPLFRSGVQIRFTPRDYMLGNVMTHCHISSHEDLGMVQLVEVYNGTTRSTLDTSATTSAAASSSLAGTLMLVISIAIVVLAQHS